MSEPLLNLNHIFPSFDGEVNYYGQGTPSVFVRLQGCNLKCVWCDTAYAQDPSKKKMVSVDHVLSIIRCHGIKKVTITGGEPLLQKRGLSLLIQRLLLLKYKITVETNGSIPWTDIVVLSDRIKWVVDYKLPDSGCQEKMLPLDNFLLDLGEFDFIKFVIDSYSDFYHAVSVQETLQGMGAFCRYAYSPTSNFSSKILYQNMMEYPGILDKALLNIQLHKLLQIL